MSPTNAAGQFDKHATPPKSESLEPLHPHHWEFPKIGDPNIVP